MEVTNDRNAWRATLDALHRDMVELNADKSWTASWRKFYDQFIADFNDGSLSWLPPSTPMHVVEAGASLYAHRAWESICWFMGQGFDHIHENEPSNVHDRLIALGLLPEEDN